MPWWTWIALGFLLLSMLATAVFTAFAFARLKHLTSVAETIQGQLEQVARAGEALEQRLAHAEQRAEEFERHRARLEGSLERLSVLTSSLSEARAGISRLQKAYLRK